MAIADGFRLAEYGAIISNGHQQPRTCPVLLARERERAEERREGERGERRGESRERDTRGKQGRQQLHTELSCIAGPGLEVGKPKSASWKYGVRIWFLVIFPSKSRRDLLLRKAMQVIFANMTLAIFG